MTRSYKNATPEPAVSTELTSRRYNTIRVDIPDTSTHPRNRSGNGGRYRGAKRAPRTTGNRSGKHAQRRPRVPQKRSLRPEELPKLKVSANSIHAAWKKELGGLVRWYYYTLCQERDKGNGDEGRDEGDWMRRLEGMYIESGCSIPKTKEAILLDISETRTHPSESAARPPWIDLSIVAESTGTKGLGSSQATKTTKLENEIRPGEGPAHSHKEWINAMVTPEMMGKPYHFTVRNQSPLDLSCEMTIDGHLVARNVPIPRWCENRTIKPDNTRYFESHQWVFSPAKKVKLMDHTTTTTTTTPSTSGASRSTKTGPRYNNRRPDSSNTTRVPFTDYPDPTEFGWTFTGSTQASRVEFFEKNSANAMGDVRLDWYYTTGTIKTTLHHPTTGTNQLFRNTVTPEEYQRILKNPRVHTDRGYRRNEQRPQDREVPVAIDARMEDMDADTVASEAPDAAAHDTKPFYAKNDHYDFQREGHVHRQRAMDHLQTTRAYRAWETAARNEYACVHAKFYVSLPKQMRQEYNDRGQGQQTKNKREREHLPQQASILDIKPAANATVGTKFHSTGQPGVVRFQRKSNIRMMRIHGLNDDPQWGSGPVFECKLYYRAEDTVQRNTDGDGDGVEDMEDTDDENEHDNVSANDNTTNPPLHVYQQERITQIRIWHEEVKVTDANRNVAESVQRNYTQKIDAAMDIRSVDDVVKQYWDWHQEQQWI